MTIPDDGKVTLGQALAFARQNAPAVLIATSELAVGEAEIEAANQVLPFNPTISVGLGQRRQAGGTGLDAQIALEQQIEIAGQRRRRQRSARLISDLKALGVDVAVWVVHAEVHHAFERALLAERRVALATERVSVNQEMLRMVSRRVELGDESSAVLEVAKADLAVAQSSGSVAAAELSTYRSLLARATGSDLSALTPVGAADAPVGTPGAGELASSGAESNPTLRLVDLATDSARASAERARREAWPSPTVGVSFAREGSTSTAANPSPASTIWMGTLQIPVPAFARNQGAIARGRAQVRVAEARRNAALVQFNSSVAEAAGRVNAAVERSRALEVGAVAGFERSLAALRRAYELGELGFLDVAQGLERLWAAREQALEARASYYDAFADLETLVGPLETAAQMQTDKGEQP